MKTILLPFRGDDVDQIGLNTALSLAEKILRKAELPVLMAH